jgi:hypothetical protein
VAYQRILLFVLLCFTLVAARETCQSSFAEDLSRGGTVLLFGDSILDCHQGDKRVEAVMKCLLEQKMPRASWTIHNEAHGGEYIGPREGSAMGFPSRSSLPRQRAVTSRL